MKNEIDKFFKENYKFFSEVIYNINGRRLIPEETQNDLISELYLHIIDNFDRISKKFIKNDFNKGLKSFCVMWLRNQMYWNSTFKKKYDIDRVIKIEYETEKDFRIDDIDLSKTPIERDLLNVYSEDELEFLEKIKYIYNNKLEQWERNLFDLYFKNNLTYKGIKELVGISSGSIHRMLKELYKKIKENL